MEEVKKKFETEITSNPYETTSNVMEELKNSFPYYKEVIHAFSEGYSSVELKKRYMIRAIDEAWVSIIEDTIPSLETIIRAPQASLKEEEEVVPIEKTKRVTSKAITHLIQHSQYINEIEPNGFVRPAKLLNVYQDDTVVSYEHRFINTLVNQLYSFVGIRYNKAVENGEDEKNTQLVVTQDFEHNFSRGKISLSIEVNEKPKKGEVIKNYIYDSNLWKRIEKIRKHLDSFMSTPFIKSMGKNFIRPPVMRTNKILKNVDFKNCLTLWEFIQSYANSGYETLVQESLESVDEKCLEDIYNSFSEQYAIFNNYINKDFQLENEFDFRENDVFHPDFKEELDPFDVDEYNVKNKVASGENENPDEELSNKIELALRVALMADNMYVKEEPKLVEKAPATSEGEEDSTGIEFKYRYSFLARLIFTQNPIQDYYTEIKNYILSHKGNTSSISWRHELFRHKKEKICLINIKGKTLCLYLPLNPAEFFDSKYNFVNQGHIKMFEDTPFLYKVRNPKSFRYAMELLEMVMNRLGLESDPSFTPKDYHYPLQTSEELLRLDPPLVRLVDASGEVIHPADKPVVDEEEEEVNLPDTFTELPKSNEVDTSDIVLPDRPVIEEIPLVKEVEVTEEVKPVEQIVKVETKVEEVPVVAEVIEQSTQEIEFKYRYSFLARFIIADEQTQNYYSIIKNAFMSYKGVKYNISWRRELFRLANEKLAYVNIKGKTIDIFFALDPKQFADTKYKVKDEGHNQTYVDTPCLYKVRNNKTLKYALELINLLVEKYDLHKNPDYEEVTYRSEPMSIEQLLQEQLIRPIEGNEVTIVQSNESEVKEVVEKVAIEKQVEVIEETPVIEPVVEETPVEEEPEPVVEEPKVEETITEPKPIVEEPKAEETPVAEEPVEEKQQGVLTPVNDHVVGFIYRYSYMARLIQAPTEEQDLYGEIKNFLLSYEGVKANISWRHELFRVAKTKLAQLKIRGKTLYLYIALDPKDIYEPDYNFVLYRNKGSKEFPFYLKIRNFRYMSRVKEVLDIFLHSYKLRKGEEQNVSYRYEYKTNDELLSMDPPLITFVEGNGEEESEDE